LLAAVDSGCIDYFMKGPQALFEFVRQTVLRDAR
jgi:hypothetical protein